MLTNNDPDAELLAVADMNARDCEFLRADLPVLAFPQSKQRPSEEMLAFIRRDAQHLLSDLIAAISQDADAQLLSDEAGAMRTFFADPTLLELLISRYAWCELEKKLDANSDTPLSQTLPARLLVDANQHIADSAQTILAASNLRRRGAPGEWTELPGELLHRAVWRLVALLEAQLDSDSEGYRKAAQTLLADYSEQQRPESAAAKFLHLTGGAYDKQVSDLSFAGLAIFIAAICDRLKLTAGHTAQLLSAPSFGVFAVIQRALNIPQELAIANIYLLHGFDLTPSDIALFENGYPSIAPEDAAQAALGWHIARVQRDQGAA